VDWAEFLTKEDMASRLKVSVRTVESWQENGLLPCLKIAQIIRFYWPDVVDHLRKHCTAKPDGSTRVRWGEAKVRAARAEKSEVGNR
jgi:hypothetical protein